MARQAYARERRIKTGHGATALLFTLCLGLLLGCYGPGWVQQQGWSRVTAPTRGLAADTLSADFTICHSGGGINCVIDGDTFRFRGEKYRIVDIDTPETHGPRCAAEGELGARATRRLRALLNAGPFSLAREARDTDRYGRALRLVTRGGESVGGILVAEDLARNWDGSRHPWC
ncbi:thermonuclease family protein [Sphingobium sp. BYY-5]|uniref:thermonuclease family protein n=1 Tax=Sphingobium sp. BYY-5 TaxID=2926400 RepID=UPI001FA6BE35|nr:thermonuclease family protein [Sphingobium sp. BYY-5]MCI4591371.1 thermonuclease family protein [Sphingobium sp. BYY-5]